MPAAPTTASKSAYSETGGRVRIDLDASFRPPRWLRNRHLQSILPSLPARRTWLAPRVAGVVAASEELLIDCGAGIRLQGFRTTQARRDPAPRLAVLLHGWEGSADSLYVLSLAQLLYDRGFDIVRLNLRDHGDTHHLNRELFHSCRLPEVIGALRCLRQLAGGGPLYLAGFSLGGNFVLRVAAQADAALGIAQAIAISPVLDPADTLRALERGWFAYHRYFVGKWTSSLLKKQAAWPGDYDFGGLALGTTLRDMTEGLLCRYTDFPSLESYLEGYSVTGSRLAGLAVPTTIITALDDPIIPARGIGALASSPALRVIVTRRGGHCGFLDHLVAPTWAERRVVTELASG